MTKLSDPDAKKITLLIRVLEKFRDIHPEMPLTQLLMLLQSATSGPISLTSVSGKLDMSISTASRAVHVLAGRVYGKGNVALDPLVEFYTNPDNFREKLIELTPAGRRLLQSVVGLL